MNCILTAKLVQRHGEAIIGNKLIRSVARSWTTSAIPSAPRAILRAQGGATSVCPGAGLDLPWSALLIQPANPNQGHQVSLTDDLFGFRRQNERVPAENVRAALRIGLVRFEALETQQRLDGHATLDTFGVSKLRSNRHILRGGIFQRQTVSAQPKERWLVSDHAVPLELPTPFPPEMCFDARLILGVPVAQAVHRRAMIRSHGNRLTLVPAINRAIREFRRKRRIERIASGGGRDFAADAGAETQLAPLPGAERDVAHADSVGVVQDLDFAIMAAHDQSGLGHGDLEI